MDMTVIGEIWKDKKVQYVSVMMEGDYIPKQGNMTAREQITASLNHNKQYEFLDVVGILVGEQLLWNDNLRRYDVSNRS